MMASPAMSDSPLPLRLCTLAMRERMIETLRLYFRKAPELQVQLVDEEPADVTILDLDLHQAGQAFAEHRRTYPERPLILLSVSQRQHDERTLHVSKPVQLERLAEALVRVRSMLKGTQEEVSTPPADAMPARRPPDALNGISRRLEGGAARVYIGTMPDVDPADPKQRAQAYYDPEDFLQGHLLRALALGRQTSRTVRLHSALFDHLDIFPVADTYRSPVADKTWRASGAIQVRPDQIRIETLTTAYAAPGSSRPTEELIWRLALLASRGRVPKGTDLEAPVILSGWPNLTRLVVPPHALRIAALWSQGPRSLLETAAVLEIPQRYVFAFYSATMALGLANTGAYEKNGGLPAGAPSAHRKRGMLRGILMKLLG